MLSKSVLTAIALVVTLVWLLSFLAQFVPSLGYKPDPQIHVIFGMLITGLFTAPMLKGRGGNSDDDSGRHRKSSDDESTKTEA